ncbi:class I SAM-dependent methyltransferase [Synechococcus sp. CS-1328]|uniref:class I SAM-dependent methyltransferase n=1 Tax=Synechococcus sp. CS-1328 TaxID=2847976 RepID=UPI00223BF62B|nr:class I SAM-dependent methyltransferase [Synechococcus sp. CS-1328]
MPSAVPMDLFEQNWSTYRAVVQHDLMGHADLTAATELALRSWLEARAPGTRPPLAVDLGCGDLSALAPVWRQLPLGGYEGIDLTAQVLPLARQALGAVPYPTRWQAADLRVWAASNDEPVDLIHTAFALHHLSDSEKAEFLRQARQRLAPGGLFLWADVFRDPGESRQDYLGRYGHRIRSQWSVLPAEARTQVLDHIHQLDHPADRAEIVRQAEAAGWRWTWRWNGPQRAEALAQLEPI